MNCLLYPLQTLGLSVPVLGLGGNLVTLGLALWAGLAAWRAVTLVGVLALLPLPWVGLATWLILLLGSDPSQDSSGVLKCAHGLRSGSMSSP